MLPDLSSDDLVQRYKDSFIQVSVNGTSFVDKVSAIDRGGVLLKFNGPVPAEQVTILREFPEMGLVNFAGNVHIIYTNPLRQWCRGLKTSRIFDVCRNPDAPLFHLKLDLNRAEALFNRTWIPLKDGIASIRKEAASSFAMNNKYWVSGNPKHQYVWRNKVCLGELLGKRVFFFSESVTLHEEISTDLKELLC